MTWLAPRRIATALLTALVVTFVTALLLPRAFGWSPYVVTSGSMEPSFGAGAVVLTEPIAHKTIEVDQVLTFRTRTGVTTHRVVDVTERDATRTIMNTQGDANNAPDTEPVDSRNVLGEVRLALPYLGYLLAAVRTPAGLVILISLLAVALWPRPDTFAEQPPRTLEQVSS